MNLKKTDSEKGNGFLLSLICSSLSSSEDTFQHKKRNRSFSKDRDKDKDISNRDRDDEEKAKAQGIKNRINFIINEKNTSNHIIVPSFDCPLISLSLFNELQPNILSDEAIETAYKDYRSKYEAKKYQSFYQEHQNDEWFKERYDPEIYLKWKNKRNTQAKKLSLQFFDWMKDEASKLKLELNEEDEFSKSIKIVLYTCNESKSDFEERERDISKMTSSKAKEKGIDITSAPYYGFDPDRQTLFIHQLPRNISRWQILDVVKKLNGYFALSVSEPIKSQSYYRFCWLSFESEEKCNLAYELLKDYKVNEDYEMHPIKSKSMTIKKIRLTPPLFDERTDEDLNHTKRLIEVYDKDKQIDNNPLFEMTNMNNELMLDLQILYLRRVHGFCYYCLKEYEDERNLATKCDNVHLRNYKCIGSRKGERANEYLDEIEFDKFFSMKVNELFNQGVMPKEPKYLRGEVNEELNHLRTAYCKNATIQLSTEEYRCSICEKKFRGANFVHNHIFNKHMEMVFENVDRKFFEKIKSENYFNDTSSNKSFEKMKMITSMEEYLNSINSLKKHQSGDRGKISSSSSYYGRSSRDKDRTKRRHGREYKDFDDPENKKSQGQLKISYDDL